MAGKSNPRVEELFDRALSLPEGERLQFLEKECSGDPGLMAEVRSLLRHQSAEFLENPEHLPTIVPDDLSDPDEIGPYRLVRPLGSGGMGVVYLAEQEQPVRRTVALKLIKLGMDTARVVARFESERQALAMMNHPNISHVYDAGASDRGRPYFVMEYVEGASITKYSDLHHLDLHDRLGLFLQVCEGLQHAHQKGIIHRDIKPANILVTEPDGRAVPKIIDFGIARATERNKAEGTLLTEHDQVVGTPQYMSPEQTEFGRDDIDTRTDVYSLGVLLYELLAGSRPFDSRESGQGGFEQIRKLIRESDPPRPSTRLKSLGDASLETAANRHTEIGLLVRALRDDLDWIILKAMEKDRDRRYATVLDLATDIRRHIVHEPVEARPPGTLYRTTKFVRRHRIGVLAASVILLALVGGVIGTTIGMIRAQSAEAVARETERFIVRSFEEADPSQTKGETITAREILDHSAARIREEFRDQPQVRGRLMLAMGRSYRGIGKYDSAEPLLRESVDLLKEAQGDDHPDVAIALNGLANVLVNDQKYAEAVPIYEEALAIWRSSKDSNDQDMGRLLRHLGDAHTKLGNYDISMEYLERSMDIFRSTLAPDNLDVARCLDDMGENHARTGNTESGIALQQEALAIRMKHSDDPNAKIDYGHYVLGDSLMRAERYEEAAVHFRAALDIKVGIHGWEFPDIGWYAFRLAEALEGTGDLGEAEQYYLKAVECDDVNLKPDHPYKTETLEGYAAFLRRIGRDEEAGILETRVSKIKNLPKTRQ